MLRNSEHKCEKSKEGEIEGDPGGKERRSSRDSGAIRKNAKRRHRKLDNVPHHTNFSSFFSSQGYRVSFSSVRLFKFSEGCMSDDRTLRGTCIFIMTEVHQFLFYMMKYL